MAPSKPLYSNFCHKDSSGNRNHHHTSLASLAARLDALEVLLSQCAAPPSPSPGLPEEPHDLYSKGTQSPSSPETSNGSNITARNSCLCGASEEQRSATEHGIRRTTECTRCGGEICHWVPQMTPRSPRCVLNDEACQLIRDYAAAYRPRKEFATRMACGDGSHAEQSALKEATGTHCAHQSSAPVRKIDRLRRHQ